MAPIFEVRVATRDEIADSVMEQGEFAYASDTQTLYTGSGGVKLEVAPTAELSLVEGTTNFNVSGELYYISDTQVILALDAPIISDSGPQGPQGGSGNRGRDGSRGPQGPQGSQGFQGRVGAIGPTGAGYAGPAGPQGEPGVSGDPGGPQGYQGSQGTQGTQGATGPQGNQGNTGTTGSQGPQGSMGEGTQGSTGAIGPQGSQGNVGVTGPQGNQGSQGTPGISTLLLQWTVTAGEYIKQYNPVFIDSNGLAYNAYNSSNQLIADSLGIVTQSGGILQGAQGAITIQGIVSDPNWGLTPGRTVYVPYLAGMFVENMPSSGYVKPIGKSLSTTDLYVNSRDISITTPYVAFTNTYSIELDGGYVSAPSSSSLDFGLNSFSVSAWFKASSAGLNLTQGIVGKIWDNANSSGNPGWAICLNSSGQVTVVLGDSTNPNAVNNDVYLMGYADYRDDLWHNVVMVIDRTLNLLLVYFDGVFRISFDISDWTNTFDSAYPVIMGGNYRKGSIDGNFKGYLDEVAIFNTGLSLQGIREVYGNGQASNLIDFSSLVAWYRMGD